MRALSLLAIVYLTGCPSKTIDRRLDESASTEIQWKNKQSASLEQAVKQDRAKKKKTTRRTPIVSTSGMVLMLPNGQPVYSVEEVDESSDTSISTKTGVHGESNTGLEEKGDKSKSSRDKETIRHGWKLMGIGVMVAFLIGVFVVVSYRKKWLFGWFW